MSEYNDSENEAKEAGFNRGSALSLFKSDRLEDMLALMFALAIALYVYLNF
jgi:hypothetical protein